MLLYAFIYLLGFALYFPKILLDTMKKGSWQVFIRKIAPKPIQPITAAGQGPIIWLHAVSLGETIAAAPVLQELQKRFPGSCIITSHGTETGFAAAKKHIPDAHAHIFLPFDFPWAYSTLLKNIPRIDLLIYSEGDLWPGLTYQLKKRGAATSIINGKVSQKSFSRYLLFPSAAHFLFKQIDLFCLQTDAFRKRFIHIGIPPNSIAVTGNTKADVAHPPAINKTVKTALDAIPKNSIIIASSHDPEEENIVQRLIAANILDKWKLVLAPRHPHRCAAIAQQIRQRYSRRRTALLCEALESDTPWDILIIDQTGLLPYIYKKVYVSIICGSFVPHVGGHNILEPAACCCPFFVGPHMHAQQFLADSALAHGVLNQCSSYDDLAKKIEALIARPSERDLLAQQSRLWMEAIQGAAQKTAHELSLLLHKKQQNAL